MTNNTQQVSVPRELLERHLTSLESFAMTFEGEVELACLLAAHAEDVRAMVDEPVAYCRIETARVTVGGKVTEWFPALIWYTPEEVAALTTPYRVIERVYRHAQRNIVLPERVDPEYFDSIRATGIGWNACLDEFKRLNGDQS